MQNAYPMVEVGFVVLSEAPVGIEAVKAAVVAKFNQIRNDDVTPGSVRAYHHDVFENGEQDFGIEAYYDVYVFDRSDPRDILYDMVDDVFPDETVVEVGGFRVKRYLLEVS